MKYVHLELFFLLLLELASVLTCSLYCPLCFFLSEGFWWGREGLWEGEMRCLNTPLPSSLHLTPPHTWDGHFISECSKWKGDLNLPCFLLTPPPSLSVSHTQCLILLMDSTLLVACRQHTKFSDRESWMHIGSSSRANSRHFRLNLCSYF